MRVLRSKWLWWPIGLIVTLIVATLVVFNASSYPGAMLTRFVFEKGGDSMKKRNESHGVPDAVVTTRDVPYLSADSGVDHGEAGDTTLDVYLPKGVGADTSLPAVVWIHGGGWVSGDKTDTDFYFQRLAAGGVAVVSLNYSRAPDRRYPTAIAQTNAALGFLSQLGRRYHIDASRLVLAGDSAGAQIASQLAAITANPAFARQVGIPPTLKIGQLRGVVLNCGVYDAHALESTTADSLLARVLTWGVSNTIWAYGGTRSGNGAMLDQMSTIDHLTANFPRVWISAGYADPLTARQTIPFVARLKAAGVATETLVYGPDEPAQLSHEFQFELGTPQGREALAQTADFVRRVTT